MKQSFEGNDIDVLTNEEFKKVLRDYKIDTKYMGEKSIDDFYKSCIDYREHCWYKVYNIELDIKNESITWIGLVESEGTIGDSAQLYYNPNLKRTALLEVMTFAEATKKWGLADSTLRKLVATDKVVEELTIEKVVEHGL